jgi:hypothetical protein
VLHADNDYFDKRPPRVIKVRTDTLDHVIPGDVKIALINIEVEGTQLQALSGAIETIKRERPYIVFEHRRNRLADSDAIYRLLTETRGLSISVTGDWLTPTLSHRLWRCE